MIPTLIVLGLVLGRWWRSTLVVAALGWPLLLVVVEATDVGFELLGAAALAVANTGAGILVHQAALRAVRSLRGSRPDRS